MTAERGFSLVEVLIALFILGIITATGTSLITSSLRGQKALDAASERTSTLVTAHAVLRDDLSQYVPRNAVQRPGLDIQASFVGGGVGDSQTLMAFIRDGWTNPGLEADRSGLLGVRYLFENNVLIREVQLVPDGAFDGETLREVLLDDLRSVEIDFREGQRWVIQWRATPADPFEAPMAVRMRITHEDRREFEWVFLTPAGAAAS